MPSLVRCLDSGCLVVSVGPACHSSSRIAQGLKREKLAARRRSSTCGGRSAHQPGRRAVCPADEPWIVCTEQLRRRMPRGTGLDALAHCLEAYCSPHYHPMSHGIALEGMRLVKDNLPRVYNDPEDLEARAEMMSAAAMGAVAFQKGLGAIHAISHPLGAVYNTHHGMTNAVVMPPVLRFNRDKIADKLRLAADYLGISGGYDGFYNFVLEFRKELGVPENLTAMGIAPDRIDELAVMALEDPSTGGNPVEMTLENTKALLADCF